MPRSNKKDIDCSRRKRMFVASIISKKGTEVVTTTPTATAKSAADLMSARGISSLAVMSGDELLGLITEREIVRGVSRHGDKVAAMPVKALMVREVYSVTPKDNAQHVMSLMTRHRIRHLLVRTEGKITGIVSIGDVVKQRLEDLQMEANVLRDVYLAKR
jgi:CBS domain-containing protein